MSELNQYAEVVRQVTSPVSNSTEELVRHIQALQANNKDVNLALLMTSALGLSAESGEFTEIVKKILFQGKPLSIENKFHLKREMGDILWYWMNACRALGLNPYDVMEENVKKLRNRYPELQFTVQNSEIRKENDL